MTTTYTYDTSARLAGYIANGSATALALDAAGNRLAETGTDGSTGSPRTRTFAYNGRNQLVSVTDSLSGTTAYTWDLEGRLTQKTTGGAARAFGFRTGDYLRATRFA